MFWAFFIHGLIYLIKLLRNVITKELTVNFYFLNHTSFINLSVKLCLLEVMTGKRRYYRCKSCSSLHTYHCLSFHFCFSITFINSLIHTYIFHRQLFSFFPTPFKNPILHFSIFSSLMKGY